MKTTIHHSPLCYKIIHFLSILQAIFCSNDTCYGPRTPTQLANSLWGKGNYTDVDTRPNLSMLIKDNPMANPNLAAPDIIRGGLSIVSINSVNQKRGEVELLVWHYLIWNDYRLAYETLGNCYPQDHWAGFQQNHFSSIWMPYIKINAVSPPIQNAALIDISPDGTVYYYEELVMKISCSLQFDEFPKDTQICNIVSGTWMDKNSTISMKLTDNPIDKVETADYTTADTIEWNSHNFSADAKVDYMGYSYATFSFSLTRKSEYYMQFVVFPVLLIVILSWGSFFINRSAVPARVTMSCIFFLTITNFIGSQLKSMPMIGCNDCWLLRFLLTSQIFTFVAILEYIICNYLYRAQKRVQAAEKIAKEEKYQKSLSDDKEQCGAPEESMRSMLANVKVDKADLLEIGGIGAIDRLLLKRDGTMVIADENVEVFARYSYPVAYLICLFVMHLV